MQYEHTFFVPGSITQSTTLMVGAVLCVYTEANTHTYVVLHTNTHTNDHIKEEQLADH